MTDQLNQPALQLLAHLGTVYADQSLARGPSLEPIDPFGRPLPRNTVRVTEVRVLPGYLDLIRTVGLERAGLLLAIAQLSVVIDGEAICTATNEELGQIVSRGRNAIGRMVGAGPNPGSGSLVGAGLAQVAHNVDPRGRRTAGRRLRLDQRIYQLGPAEPVPAAVQQTAAPPPVPLHGTRAEGAPLHDVPAHGSRALGSPTHGDGAHGRGAPDGRVLEGRADRTTSDDAPTAPTAQQPCAPPSDGPAAGSLEGTSSDDDSSDRDASASGSGPAALTRRMLQLGFQGADDVVRRHPPKVVAAALDYVEAHEAEIARPGAYLHRLIKAGGPSPDGDTPVRPQLPAVSGPPLQAPGRPTGPVRDLPPEATTGDERRAGRPPDGGPIDELADETAAVGDQQPSPTGGRSDHAPTAADSTEHAARREPVWPPAELDAELVAAVEAEVEDRLSKHAPRSGRLWVGYCRAVASEWWVLPGDEPR